MKKQIGLAVLIGSLVVMVDASHAAWAPEGGQLENFDQRSELPGSQPAATSQAVPGGASAARVEALATIESRVPSVQIQRDTVLQTPRMVRASHGFLTGKGGYGGAVSRVELDAIPADDKHRTVKAFLNENSGIFGHHAGVLSSAQVKRDYATEHNGLRTTVWQQTLEDVPVFEGLLVGHVTRDGELVSISSHFVPDTVQAADSGTPNRSTLTLQPTIPAAAAVVRAAANVGLEIADGSLAVSAPPLGAEQRQSLVSDELMGSVEVQQVWLPMSQDAMRLCWRVVLGVPSSLEHYLMLVDVETGEVLVRRSLTQHLDEADYNVFTSDSPSPFTPGWPTPDSGQPDLVERDLVTVDALDLDASPDGWVPDGPNPRTVGNNADAFLARQLNSNINGEWVPDRPRPVGGANRVFDFPMDLTGDTPLDYADASTVELFYWANWYHDRTYQLGFTEDAGNFQMDNFGRGGLEADPVLCLVQAGADLGFADNAMFYTPPDGISGECYMFILSGPSPNRDGSLDQEVVIHELTHGLSSRLVGGGVGISQLQTAGMGEGWSDFYGLSLLSEESDDIHAVYPMGGYLTYQLAGLDFTENYYYGIRRYPYTTDMSKNPLTFKDIDPTQADPHIGVPISPIFGGGNPAEVHNQGEVWCIALWEVRANLVEKYGWAIGNELVLQLVTDGMKLAPANPNFLEARDAIIQADEINSGGANFSELWIAFAKRGMGFSAASPGSDTTIGVVEAFDAPNPDGLLEVTVRPPSFSSFFTEETAPMYVRVTDVASVTNATVTATASGGVNLVFRNDGVDPDQTANDSIYTATFEAPVVVDTVGVTLVISAPEKDTSTNVVTYYIVAPPLNDNFANSTKAPVKGASYLTSNRGATFEPDEPFHANLESATNSLWWDYVALVDTNVLVDAAGSQVRSVVAVYTNGTLATLQPVVSAVGSGNRPGPFLYIPAKAGVPYHIAVTSVDPDAAGTLNVQITPVSQPDTNAPVVTVTSPPSGILVTTNRLLLTGTAVDQGQDPSGIKEIRISVSPAAGSGATTTTLVIPSPSLLGPVSTNWSSIVGPLPGVNEIRVTTTDFAGNESHPVLLTAIYRPLDPINDFFANAIPLIESAITNVNTLNATKEVGEPNHAGNAGGNSAWWTYQPAVDGILSLSTTNSSYDTLLAIYTGSSVATLTPVSSNDDAYDGTVGTFSQLDQAVRSNTTYNIAVDGYGGAAGVTFLSYAFTPAQVYTLTVTNTAGGVALPPSNDYTNGSVVSLQASPISYYEFDKWQGSVSSTENPLSVTVTNDMSLTAAFKPVVFSDGFESDGLEQLPWVTGGDAPWIVQTNSVRAGSFAAQSGEIGDGEISSLQLTTNLYNDATLSFEYRVSSEPLFDKLMFYVDGGSPVLVQAGEVSWTRFQFPVTDGVHTFEWRYVKDATASEGEDAAYIDNVDIQFEPSIFTMHLTNVTFGAFDVVFTGLFPPGQQFLIEASTDVTTWETVSTNLATNSVVPIVDPTADQHETRYYRSVAP